jgi:tRNA (mo5U34)-methyltransferase
MKHFKDFNTHLSGSIYSDQKVHIQTELLRLSQDRFHGSREGWEKRLQQLPQPNSISFDISSDTVRIGHEDELNEKQHQLLTSSLRELHPWRKGPFSFFGTEIDTEWRSDLKWNRLIEHVHDLEGRDVLDVGCGSGYHCWRMLGAGANSVVGIDPSQLYWYQFLFAKHFLPELKAYFLPIGMEHFPAKVSAFDTVFSMGVLYHRKSPFEHLERLRGALRPKGQLVLETLVIKGECNEVLVPQGRYAQMKNVWFLPSTDTLLVWLKKAGFSNARLVNVCATTNEEQRKTEWMTFHSLDDFLDASDPSLTIEGHPAPIRAIILAER